MITIFSYFCQISAKKWAFFLQNQCYDLIFAKTSSSLNKNANIFAKFFRRKYLKNHNIGPRIFFSDEKKQKL
jgi:hypothetical protein